MGELAPAVLDELRRLAPFDPEEHGDWEAVLDRANAQPGVRRRRLQRPAQRGPRSLLTAAVVVLAVAAAPALAFSTPLRQFLGLEYPPVGSFKATITTISFPKTQRYALPKVTVAFSIGKSGKLPGSGIPKGTIIIVSVGGKSARGTSQTVVAHGANGRYRATALVPPGGIAVVYVMGFLPSLRAPNGVYFSAPIVLPDRSSQ
ncbi:MAG TPA: hypothetical protein VFA97_10345 [Gaiellaceae bacterium]|nr:hypothetical protein [Gaiellaceae bacterium]